MKLYMSDFYKIEIKYPLDDVSFDILHLLYQPIIGSRSLNLYMTMMSEGKRMGRFIQPCSLHRLSTLIGMDLEDLEVYLRVLEGINLLRTYVRYDHDMTFYLYELLNPLPLEQFFKNHILQTLLYEAIGKEDFDLTKNYFKLYSENKDNFEEITASFSDVFHIDLNDVEGKVIRVDDHFINRESEDLKIDYDFELLYGELKNYQVPRYIFKEDDETLISQYGLIYSIEPIMMASIIKDSITNNRLDHDLFIKNIENYNKMQKPDALEKVYLKQPIQYCMNNTGNSQLLEHLRYLEKISPYELLKQKQGGKEPTLHDLQIVETLMVKLDLKPAVVNILIEYVLGTNNQRLTRSFCEAIGSSWARKKINTVEQAYNEIHPKEKKEQSVKVNPPKKEVRDNDTDDHFLEEYDRLLESLIKEGKL